ncbi:MAG: hypothetical protein ACOCWR_01760 [Oceanidesulfovibrio sp.]
MLRKLAATRRIVQLDPYMEVLGSIHFHLLRELSRLDTPPRIACLMEDVSRRVWGRRQLLGPGDVLTLLYTFDPSYSKPAQHFATRKA